MNQTFGASILCFLLAGCSLTDDYYLDPQAGGAGGAQESDGKVAAGDDHLQAQADASRDAVAVRAKDGEAEATSAPVELARNKSVLASSEQTSKGNLAPRGNDGDPATRWSAAEAATPKWWRVDLGAVHRLSRIEIDWEFARPYGYLLEVSDDDVSYSTLVDRSASTDASQTESAEVNASGRYVRITVTAVTISPISWPSFWEARVFGL